MRIRTNALTEVKYHLIDRRYCTNRSRNGVSRMLKKRAVREARRNAKVFIQEQMP